MPYNWKTSNHEATFGFDLIMHVYIQYFILIFVLTTWCTTGDENRMWIPCQLEKEQYSCEIPHALTFTLSNETIAPNHGRKLNFFWGLVESGIAIGALVETLLMADVIRTLSEDISDTIDNILDSCKELSTNIDQLLSIALMNMEAIENLSETYDILTQNAIRQSWAAHKLASFVALQSWLGENLLSDFMVFETLIQQLRNHPDPSVQKLKILMDTFPTAQSDTFYIVHNPFRWTHATSVYPILTGAAQALGGDLLRVVGDLYFPHFSQYIINECWYSTQVLGMNHNIPRIDIFSLQNEIYPMGAFQSLINTGIIDGSVQCATSYSDLSIKDNHASFSYIIRGYLQDAAFIDNDHGIWIPTNPKNFLGYQNTNCYLWQNNNWYTIVQGDFDQNIIPEMYPGIIPKTMAPSTPCISLEGTAKSRFVPDKTQTTSLIIPQFVRQVMGLLTSEESVSKVGLLRVPAFSEGFLHCFKYKCQTATPLSLNGQTRFVKPYVPEIIEFCDVRSSKRVFHHWLEPNTVGRGIPTTDHTVNIDTSFFVGINEIDLQHSLIDHVCTSMNEIRCQFDVTTERMFVLPEQTKAFRDDCTFANFTINCSSEYTCIVDNIRSESCQGISMRTVEDVLVLRGDEIAYAFSNLTNSENTTDIWNAEIQWLGDDVLFRLDELEDIMPQLMVNASALGESMRTAADALNIIDRQINDTKEEAKLLEMSIDWLEQQLDDYESKVADFRARRLSYLNNFYLSSLLNLTRSFSRLTGDIGLDIYSFMEDKVDSLKQWLGSAYSILSYIATVIVVIIGLCICVQCNMCSCVLRICKHCCFGRRNKMRSEVELMEI